MGNSKRYLIKDNSKGKYDNVWHLIVPAKQEKGEEIIDAAI